MQEVEKIPFHRPIQTSISDMLGNNHMLSNGDHVKELEEQIKNLYNVEYVVACSSCTQGLLLSLQALRNLYPFDYVQTPAFAWFSSKWVIECAWGQCNFRDINQKTWLMEPFGNDMDLYLPVHTFGSIYNSNNEFTIYDGAHALGSKIKDFGYATVFSLAPTKLITSCEGGLILTNTPEIANTLTTKDKRGLRDLYSRMSELNAIWGLETLKNLDEILQWKRTCYYYYKNHLPGQFQEIPYSSNFNCIGFLTDMKMPPDIEFRKYYFPLKLGLPHTNYVYSKIVCLPSWFGVDYELIVEKILGFNEVIKG